LDYKKQEAIVWKEMKNLHLISEWRSGIFENEKYIESFFTISDGQAARYFYMLYDGSYHCRVKVLESFPIEATTEIFVLASHFNNILKNGVVTINVNDGFVEFHQKIDQLIPLLYPGELHNLLLKHYNTSKDIYTAFQRLLNEGEAPAIIIADLLNKNRDDNKE
jgi:hypothetical protein